MKARVGLMLGLLGGTCAWGQNVISAQSGMINYVEGEVLLEGQPVNPKFGEFPMVKNNQVLETKGGRAEVILIPGASLRLAENSSFKMLSTALSDTAFEVLSGSLIVEADALDKDNAITVRYKDATIALKKHGLYRVESSPGEFMVYDGEAEVTDGLKSENVHKGKKVKLDQSLLASSFDPKDTDAFYRWTSRRSEYLAVANMSAARAAGTGSCSGFAASTVCNPGGLSPYGSWAWNPFFGTFTFLPGVASVYSPFGWAYYSPFAVNQFFIPAYYTGFYYTPGYVNVSSGPTGLSGARQSPAAIAASANNESVRLGNMSNSAQNPSMPGISGPDTGGYSSPSVGSVVSSPAGGGGVSAGGGGGVRGGGGRR